MIERLIKNIAKCLSEEKIPYMIIGGQAVLLYGTPRLTRDIDITLGVDTDKFSLIEKVCRKLKLKILPEDPIEFARATKVLPAEDVKLRIRVDFIFSFTQYETHAIKRSKRVLISGYPVKFASCEDIIIHKMLAARAIDEEDIKSILIKNKNFINTRYIKKWLGEFSNIDGYNGIIQKFNSLLKQ
jgi:predicted nucleotidyltransferase